MSPKGVQLTMYPIAVGCLAQGNLDVKYLSDRYQKGLDAVDAMLDESQRFIHVDDLTEAANDVVSHMAKTGHQS